MTSPSPAFRWFPGYTVAAASTLAFFATAPGQTFIASQLNTPLRETFGITPLTLNTSYAIATIAAAFPLVIVGRWADRIGPRHMMALIALLFGAACFFMASVLGPITVFVGFFLLRFLGQGALALVSQHAIAMWFHRRLGTVHALLQVTVFGLWIAFPPLAIYLIQNLGWREAYIIFGIGIWLLVIPVSLIFVRNKPEDLGLRPDNDPPESGAAESPAAGGLSTVVARGVSAAPLAAPEAAFTLRDAARTRAYWTLTAVFFLSPLIGTAFLFDMQPMLLGRGMTFADAALAVSAWTATMGIMALPSGLLTDRVRPSVLIAAGMTMILTSALILMLAATPLAAAAGMVAFGIGQSITATCASATLARYFGRRHHGAIRSATMRLGVIGTGMGPIFTGISERLTGEYTAAMVIFMLMCVPVMVLALILRPPERPALPTPSA